MADMTAADLTYAPPADLDAVRSRALMVGGAGLVACAVGFFFDRDHFFRAWLIGYLLWLGVALGSMALLMVQHLSGGSWGIFKGNFQTALKVGRPVARQAISSGKAFIASECPLAGEHIVQGMERLDATKAPEHAWHPIQLFARAYGLQ